MHNPYSLMACTSLAALLWGSVAAAQTAAPPPPGDAQSTAGSALEEVIVTAQRRAQGAQSVPVTITAFDANQIERAGVQSLVELSRVSPGLQFQAVGANSIPYLRGIGAATSTAGAEAAVALVVDGVYVSAQPASLMGLSNIQSVEVDRGPQGTLFGRNATGGVIQITTRRPDQTRKLDVAIGYGNFGTWDGAVYASTPLTSNLAADLSFSAHDQTQGFGKNLFNGEDVYTSYDYSIRSKIAWRPTDKTDVTLVGSSELLKSQVGFANRLPLPGELGLNQRGRGGFQFSGGFYDVNLNYPSYNLTRTSSASVDIQHDLGFAKVRSITAYDYLHWIGQVDFDLTPNTGSHQRLVPTEKTTSEELQLLSPDSAKRFTWVLGAYLYSNIAGYHPVHIQYPAGGVLSETFVHSKQKTKSWALFGQGTYEILPDTHLTAGLRYTEDERDFIASQTSVGPLPGRLVQQGSKTFPKLTYRFSLDHRFEENMLAYATVSRGFKSGFYNNLSLQPSNSSTPAVINPETLDAYEIGVKSDWMNRRLRLNLSGFFYNYKDQQVNAFVGTTRILFNAANSHVKGLDLEVVAIPVKNLTVSLNGELLDAKYQDFPGAPLFTPAPPPGIGNVVTAFNAAGKTDPNSPTFTSTVAVDYTIPTVFGRLTLGAEYYHNSGYYFDFANTRKQSPYDDIGASAKLLSLDGRWDLTIWVKNLLNERVYASVNPIGSGPGGLFGGDGFTPRPPRTFGMRIGAHL